MKAKLAARSKLRLKDKLEAGLRNKAETRAKKKHLWLCCRKDVLFQDSVGTGSLVVGFSIQKDPIA